MSDQIIQVVGLKNYLGGHWVHQDVNLSVNRGEIVAIIGGSGSGKTTILRSILMLLRPTEGQIRVFGQDIAQLNEQEENEIRRRWGVLFQHSALFSGMTVLENVMFPMRELVSISSSLMHQLALLKLILVGLPVDAANKYPAQLSGGMQKRAATARAIAMEPELVFFDEPTSGLDPQSARHFDDLIVFLRNTLNLTIVMISHDIESLIRASDRVAFIGEGRVLAVEPIAQLMKNKHPLIAEYFSKL